MTSDIHKPIPKLTYHKDGTPSILRPSVNYRSLRFFQRADVLYQLTKVFCQRFLPHYGDRTVDQMVQAARSCKQNIAEGITDGQTSVEIEVKLLGVARGSNQELLEDYVDYIKLHRLQEWHGANARFEKLHDFCRENSHLAAYQPFLERWSAEEMANCCICLCHMVDKALETYIKKLDKQFVEEGGIRERMTAARIEQRTTQKEQIAHLQAENAALREEIAALKRKLEKTGFTGITGDPGKTK